MNFRQSFNYVGDNQEECKKILQELTKQTEVLPIKVTDLQFYSLIRITKGEYHFRTFYPQDVAYYDITEWQENTEKRIIDAKTIGNVFASDDIKNLNSESLMFCVEKNEHPYYLVPTREFIVTFIKILEASGPIFRTPSVSRDIFLASESYDRKDTIYVITRKISPNYCRLFACVSDRYRFFQQENVFPAVEAAEKKMGKMKLESYRITEKITKISFLFTKKIEGIFEAGVQITMSDIGDASTTLSGYIKIGKTRIYTNKIQHSHRKKLTTSGYEENIKIKRKETTVFVDGMQQYIEQIGDSLDPILKMLKKTKRKKIDNPMEIYRRIEEEVPLKKALGNKLYDSVILSIQELFASKKRQYYLQDVVIALARLALVKEEITFSTLETLRETLGKTLPIIEEMLEE